MIKGSSILSHWYLNFEEMYRFQVNFIVRDQEMLSPLSSRVSGVLSRHIGNNTDVDILRGKYYNLKIKIKIPTKLKWLKINLLLCTPVSQSPFNNLNIKISHNILCFSLT